MTTERQAGRGFQEGVADIQSACLPRYLSIKAAAKHCEVSRWTIQKWVAEEGLRRVKIGRTVRFDRQDLDAFMQEHAE